MSCKADAHGRDTFCDFSDPLTPDVTSAYDAVGRLVSASSSVYWKTLPQVLGSLMTPEAVQGCNVCLMFQDEARFGRMVRIRRRRVSKPLRPIVDKG